MIKTISKQAISAAAMLLVAGSASAAFTDPAPFLYSLPGVSPVGSPNITTTGGSLKFKIGSKGSVKLSYKAKGSKGTSVFNDLSGSTGIASGTSLTDAKVKIKKGVLLIEGVDPLTGQNGILVSANYDEDALSASNVALNQFGTTDVLGFNITGLDCPMWTFCTLNESVYITGEFGTDVNNIKVKGSKAGGATAVTTIPVPAAVWLFGTGLLGLVGVARRRNVS